MRRFKNLLLALTSITLASCGKECINHIDSNHDGKCDVCDSVVPVNHIDNNDDNICDVCEADLSKNITIDIELFTMSWNQDLRDYIAFVLGEENENAVPAMPAKSYKVYLEEIPYEDGSGSQVACVINCNGITVDTAMADYEEILLDAGFYLGSSSDYAYKKLTATSDLIIQYTVHVDRKGNFLELIIYEAETKLTEWPADKIMTLIGVELPVYPCEAYEFYYTLDINYSPVVMVYDHNTGDDGLVKYHNQIMATGDYDLVSNTADGYSYLSKDGKIELSIYPTEDEYNLDSIYVTASNNWPYFYTTMMLGEDIPCLDIENMEYMFQDLDGDEEAEYLTIFFDNATFEQFETYCTSFERAGWALDEVESGDVYKFYSKVIDGAEKEIELLYSTVYSSICVAFTE